MLDTTSTPAPTAPLATDLPCLHCRYNLRTLSPAARCPECNTPVADSLALQSRSAGLDLRQLFRGSLCLAFAALIPALTPMLESKLELPSPRYSVLPLLFDLLTTLIQAVFLFLGIRWLAAAKPRRPGRQLLRLFCLAYPFLLAAPKIAWFLVPDGHPYARLAIRLTSATEILWQFGLFVIGFLYLRDIAQRLRRPWLITASAWVLAGLVYAHVYRLLDLIQSTLHDPGYFGLARTASYEESARHLYKFLHDYWNDYPDVLCMPMGLLFIFWLFVAGAAAATIRGPAVDRPVGLLIDSPPPAAPNPADPNRFAAFRLTLVRIATVALALIPPLAILTLIAAYTYPRAIFGTTRFSINLMTAMLILALAATTLLFFTRRQPLNLHVIRAGAAWAITLAATFVYFTIHDIPPRTPIHWTMPPDADFLWWCAVFLLVAARAFFLNFSRDTAMRRLAAWTRLAPAVAFLLLLPSLIRLWAGDMFHRAKPFASLDPLCLPLTIAALILLSIYAIVCACTLLRLPNPATPQPPKSQP